MTRRGYVAGALVVLVLVGVSFGVVREVRGRDAELPRPSGSGYYEIEGEPTCATDVRPLPALPLDAEPVAMLVCADPKSSTPWVAPAELVEGDLSELVDLLDGLEPAPDEDVACTMQGGPAYDLVLRFSRDRVARVHGDTGTCGFVTTAAGRWFGAQQVLDAALSVVERERVGRTPPAAASRTADLSCDHVLSENGPVLSLTGEAAEAVRLVSCWQPDAPELGPASETAVRPHDAQVLERDLAAHATTGGDRRDLRCPGGLDHLYFQHLLGQTAWGDVVAMFGECHRFLVPAGRAGDSEQVWHPSPRSQRILDRLRR